LFSQNRPIWISKDPYFCGDFKIVIFFFCPLLAFITLQYNIENRVWLYRWSTQLGFEPVSSWRDEERQIFQAYSRQLIPKLTSTPQQRGRPQCGSRITSACSVEDFPPQTIPLFLPPCSLGYRREPNLPTREPHLPAERATSPGKKM
jgi:hypothetical protein